MGKEALKLIPKVDVLLAQDALQGLEQDYTHDQLREAVRAYLDGLRAAVLDGTVQEVGTPEQVAADVANTLRRRGAYSLRPVINATGVVLHTNLGRAPLGHEVAQHVAQVAEGYSNLEYNLERGERGIRYAHIEKVICEVTGAEAAMVVNNNAGAVFLMLNTLCQGQGVAVSRGEEVEIGGAFRVPEIMVRSGANLIEVGTTNKTHLSDYQRALSEQGASALLKVHTSNFVMVGFTENVSVAELAQIAKPAGALVLYDMGAAPLYPLQIPGLGQQDTIKGLLKDGADVVCFSGDKLAGSAQGGILVGRKDLIDRIKKNQLTRMLRIDKMSLAALEMTMQLYRDPKQAAEKIPVVRMLAMDAEACRAHARALDERIANEVPGIGHQVLDVQDEVGGGSMPGVMLDGAAVAIDVPGLAAAELERRLRDVPKPVITRLYKDRVLVCVRTLQEGDDGLVCEALAEVARGVNTEGIS